MFGFDAKSEHTRNARVLKFGSEIIRLVVLLGCSAYLMGVNVGGAIAYARPIPHSTGPGTSPAISLALSSYSVDASDITYSLSFVATDGLTKNSSIITLTAAPGTLFPRSACNAYSIDDDTLGDLNACSQASYVSSAKSKLQNEVHIQAGVNVSAGDTVTVIVNGVRNPSKTGKTDLVISTSSDPSPVSVPVTFVSESGVSAATWTSQPQTSSKLTTQLISFVSTDGLTAHSSVISAIAPVAYPAGGCGVYSIVDDTTLNIDGCASVTLTDSNQEILAMPSFRVNPGDEVTIVAHSVGVDTAKGSQPAYSVATTSDPKIEGPSKGSSGSKAGSIAPPHLSVSSTDAGASNVTYALSFGLPAAVTANKQSIGISAPSGTVFPKTGCAQYIISDPEQGTSQGCVTGITKGSNTVNLKIPLTIVKGEVVTVLIPSVTNSAHSGKSYVTLSDSGAPGGWTDGVQKHAGLNGQLSLDLIPPTTVLGLTGAVATSHSSGATEVSYSLSLAVDHALTSGEGMIDLSVPAAFTLPGTKCAQGFGVADDTLGLYNDCPIVSAQTTKGRTTVALKTPFLITAGDEVTVTVSGVGNPRAQGAYMWDLNTTSDPKSIPVTFSISSSTKIG